MLERELVNRRVFILDRSTMSERLKEQGYGDMGIVDPNSVVKAGKELGAQWQISVELTQFGDKTSSFGGGLLDRVGFGGAQIRTSKSQVEVTAKIIDIETSRVLAYASGKGEQDGGISFSLGAGRYWDWAAGINFSSQEWLSSRLGKASQKAIVSLAENLACEWPERDTSAASSGDGVSYKELFEKKKEAAPETQVSCAALKPLTFVVVVPETILSHVRVPDPAVQTEIIKALLDAGLKVKDDEQTRRLCDDTAVAAMLKGTVDEAKLHELRSRFGADVLIVGEAIAEANNQQIGGQPYTMSRARVEVRAIQMDTGRILATDDATLPGRDLSDTLSAKNAFKNAGAQVAPKLIAMMTRTIGQDAGEFADPTTSIEIEIGGWASRSDAQEFLEAVKDLSGVKSAIKREFSGGTLFADVVIRRSAAEDFAVWLESNSKLKKYGVKIDTDSKGKIKGTAKPGA
jgi:curli biogenesis system outer membrane secretion channel CsgG